MAQARLRLAAVVAVTALACALAGCGASSDASSGHSGGSPVNIGILAAITGPFATGQGPAGPMCQGWAKYMDDNGGLDGHTVNCIVGDTGGGAAAAAAAAKKLIQQDKVVFIILDDPSTETAAEPLIAAAKIPTMGSYYVPSGVNWFRTSAGFPTIVTQMAAGAAAIGAKRATYLYCAESAACAESPPIFDSALKQYGITAPIARGIETPATAASYTSECLSLKQAGVDYANVGLNPGTIIQVAKQCAAQGYTPIYGLSDGTVNVGQFQNSGVADLRFAGGLDGFPWWSNAAPVKSFRAFFAKYVPGQDYRNDLLTENWGQYQVLEYAIGHAKPSALTPASITEALYAMPATNLGGLLSTTLSFSKAHPTAPVPCYWPYKADNLQFQSLTIPGKKSGNGVTGDLQSTCESGS
jgi:branched-chain amino acid transport system substrate-binding protein